MVHIESNKKKDERLNRIALKAYETLGLKGDIKIELQFTTKTRIKNLNKQFRGIDKVTDVLSFPLLDKIKLPFNRENYPFDTDEKERVNLGSIIICLLKARENALEYGHTEEREVNYLFIHGFLHLLGYDHKTEQEKREMRRIEEMVLREAQ